MSSSSVSTILPLAGTVFVNDQCYYCAANVAVNRRNRNLLNKQLADPRVTPLAGLPAPVSRAVISARPPPYLTVLGALSGRS